MSAGSKLNPNEQIELVKRIAWHWRPRDIEKFIKDEYGKRISDSLVCQYKEQEKWKPIIEKFRDEYHKTLTEVPLANKRKRLDELQKMYENAIDSGDVKEARSIIHDFREEMERRIGDISFSFTQVNHNEFHEMTDEDLQKEKVKTLEQLEKVRRLKLLAQGGSDGLRREIAQETKEIKEIEEEIINHE